MNLDDYYPSTHGFPAWAFVEAPPRSLECAICTDTLNNPRQCRLAHAFCLYCITTALQVNPTCPSCREPLTMDQLSLSGKREIVEELQAYCCTRGIELFPILQKESETDE